MRHRSRWLCCLFLAISAPLCAQTSGPGVLPGAPSFTGTLAVPFRAPDGTASAPSYSWSADTDTGLYRIGADNVGFSAGGTLRWDYNTTRILSTISVIAPLFGGASASTMDLSVNGEVSFLAANGTGNVAIYSGTHDSSHGKILFSGNEIFLQTGAGARAFSYFGDVSIGAAGSASEIYGRGAGVLGFQNTAGTAGFRLDMTLDAVVAFTGRASGTDIVTVKALAGQFGSVRGTAVAFASLPAAPVEGMIVAVTDGSTNTWGATLAGGGANHVLAYYNGTNWTVIGK